MSSKKWGVKEWLIFILVVILVVATVGLILSAIGEKEKRAEEQPPDNITRIKKRIDELDKLIKPLAEKRDQLRHAEKRFMIRVRVLIAAGILGGNLGFWFLLNTKGELGTQLNFNEAWLLAYSFVGFIISGTPARFAISIKKGAVKWLNKEHQPMLIELVSYEEERKMLIEELQVLESAAPTNGRLG